MSSPCLHTLWRPLSLKASSPPQGGFYQGGDNLTYFDSSEHIPKEI